MGKAIWIVLGVVAALGAFLFAREQATGGGEAVEPPARGLPHTPDYHSLFVFPSDPEHLLLGTHVGIYESTDGGERWRFLALEGKDAMHFGREGDGTIWVAGHNVLERSEDDGKTWKEARPEGLPGRDIHGFAVDLENLHVYAAVAGKGLYRSDDGGKTFRSISEDVGPGVYALALTNDGVLIAADSERGVLENSAGDGVEWTELLDMKTVGLAATERDPPNRRILAAGESVQLFTDEASWRKVLDVADGAGPVAFAPSDPTIAYAVSFDRKLHRSEDGGETWRAVE